MSNRYANLVGANKIKDEYVKINTGFDIVQAEIDAEIANRNTGDYDLSVALSNVDNARLQADNVITARIDNHVNSTTEKHPLSGITNDSTVLGASAKTVVESLQGQISSISAAGANAQIGVYAVSATGTNTLTSTFTGLTYYAGMKMNWSITADNTGAVTMNVNSLGAKNVYKVVLNVKTALSPRDLRIGEIAQLQYDGTDFILLNGNRNEEYSVTQISTADITTLPSTAQGLMDSFVVEGRTDVNLLTDAVAGCESTSGWSIGTATISTDSTNKLEGINCLKMTLTSTSGYLYTNILSSLFADKYYLISAYIKNGNLSGAGCLLKLNLVGDVGNIVTSYVTGTSYTRVGIIIRPTDFDTATNAYLYLFGYGANTEYAYIDAVALQEISSTDYALGVPALLNKYTWHLGTKSVDKMRVKSVGKNLVYGDWIYGSYINIAGTILSDADSAYNPLYVKVKSSTQYTLSTVNTVNKYVFFYDINKVLISYTSSTNTLTITTPSNCIFIRLSYFNMEAYLPENQYPQLELGSVATTYEPYQQSQSVCPLQLRAVPSMQDTWDSVRGKRVQNVKEYTLVSGDVTVLTTSGTNVDVVRVPKAGLIGYKYTSSTGAKGSVLAERWGNDLNVTDGVFDNASYIGLCTANSINDSVSFIVAKGTYASLATAQTALAGTKMLYQLATPITTYLQPSVLQATANGTIYQERFVEDYGFYNSGLALTDSTKLITNLVEVRKWNIQTGAYTIIPNSSVTLTTGVITAITSAVAGEFYSFDYNYDDSLSLVGELNYSYSTNTVGQLQLNTENILTLDGKVNDLNKSYERLSPGYEDLQFSIGSGKVPAANFPAFETFTTNTNEYSFAVNDYIDLAVGEPPHDHKLGQTCDFHLHLTTKAANATGANRYAKFTIYVSYAAVAGVWTETSITAELTIPTGTLALTNMYLSLPGFNLGNVGIGGQIKVRVKRIAATGGTEYSGSIFSTQLGLHYIADSLGSSTPTTK